VYYYLKDKENIRPFNNFLLKKICFLFGELNNKMVWIKILHKDNFLQIHRVTIINTEYIDRIEIQPDKNYLVFLKSSEEPLRISHRFAKKLTKKFYT